MSIWGTLRIGASGMTANSFGASVASNNIANASTEGYVRRLASMEQLGPPPQAGAGVRATGANRVIDPFLFKRILNATSEYAFAEGRGSALGVLDQIFSEGPGSLLESIDSWESAISEFANNPEDLAARQQMLYESENLADRFRSTATSLNDAVHETGARIEDEITTVNEHLKQIAAYNAKISQIEVTGQEASQLRDERDLLVSKVAESIPITTVAQNDGTVSVLLGGGISLVSAEGTFNPINAVANANGTVSLTLNQAGAAVDITSNIDSGRVGGWIAAQTDLSSSLADLDQLAADTIAAYNGVHQSGFGLDGVGNRNLFEPAATVSGAALNFSVSADVAGNPQALAAATDPASVPGDNRNALALVDLANSNIANGGTQTVNEALAAMTAASGSLIRDAALDLDFADGVMGQLQALQESISGVSVDEEMISLTQYQRAYEASLTVVRTADEMLAELVNLKR